MNQEVSYYLEENRQVRACSSNDEGQLGNGTFVNASKKDPAVAIKLSVKILDLCTGQSSQSTHLIGYSVVYII